MLLDHHLVFFSMISFPTMNFLFVFISRFCSSFLDIIPFRFACLFIRFRSFLCFLHESDRQQVRRITRNHIVYVSRGGRWRKNRIEWSQWNVKTLNINENKINRLYKHWHYWDQVVHKILVKLENSDGDWWRVLCDWMTVSYRAENRSVCMTKHLFSLSDQWPWRWRWRRRTMTSDSMCGFTTQLNVIFI